MALVDWKAIDTVLLDMDGTLLDLAFDNNFWLREVPKHYAQAHNLSLEEANAFFDAELARTRGTLDWYSTDYWSAILGIDIVGLKRQFKQQVIPRPHCFDLLKWLKQINMSVFLVTNAHPDALELKLSQVPLTPWFDGMVSSHSINAPKEALLFWQRLASTIAFEPEKTLLIDDTEAVLATAQAFGIAHLFSLAQPDMSQPPRQAGSFPAIGDFTEIIGTTNIEGGY